MEKVLQNRNLLFKLIEYSSIKDVFNAGGTCKVTRSTIRQRDELWKDVVCHFYPNDLWAEMNLDTADYLLIAINKEPIRSQLMRLYVLYRLQQPISTPNGLAIYLQIKTPTLPAPWDKTILIGEIDYDDQGKHRLVFRKKDKTSFYLWWGEEGHDSDYFFYMINRRKKGSYNPDDCKIELNRYIHRTRTILRDSQKEEINRLLKLDLWKEQPNQNPIQGVNNNNAPLIQNRGNLFYSAFVSSSQQQREYKIYVHTEWSIYPDFEKLFEQITGHILPDINVINNTENGIVK